MGEPQAEPVKQEIGNWILEQQIGEGGMGSVHFAHQASALPVGHFW